MRRSTQHISLDLMPLIDVVFLLLIFFMLSTSFEETQWLDLQLPTIDEREESHASDSKPVVIGIDAAGHFHIDEKNLGEQNSLELKEYLSELLSKDSAVVIHGDAKAPHASLVQLLDVLGQLKIAQLHIAAIEEK